MRNEIVFLGWTQAEIREEVGMTQGRIVQIIKNVDFDKINNEMQEYLKQGRKVDWLAEHYGLTLRMRLYGGVFSCQSV